MNLKWYLYRIFFIFSDFLIFCICNIIFFYQNVDCSENSIKSYFQISSETDSGTGQNKLAQNCFQFPFKKKE